MLRRLGGSEKRYLRISGARNGRTPSVSETRIARRRGVLGGRDPTTPSGRWRDRDSVGPSEFRTFQYLTLQREIHHSWKSNVFGSPIYYWPLLVKTEFLENANFSENGRISESPPWRGRRAENAGRRKKFLQYRPRNPEFYREFSKSMAIWRAAK